MPKIGLFIHLYYDDTLLSVYKQIKNFLTLENVEVFINFNQKNPHFDRILKIVSTKFPKAHLIRSTNKGKDIGGKLALIDLYLRLDQQLDYLVFLHDKKSPQLVDGDKWQNELFNIINEENTNKVIDLFSNKEIGMIGNRVNIISKKTDPESKIFVTNRELVLELAKQYQLTSKTFDFIGGTMFWVKEEIYRDFFTKYPPLQIRKSLEHGNVMDDFGPTITHSWERLLGWIVTSNGYNIVGI